LKEAYEAEFASVIERAEKQIILAKHGQRLLDLLDDSPITPGDARRVYENGNAARQILNDAEDDLKSWEKNHQDGFMDDRMTEVGADSGIQQTRGEDSTESDAMGTSTDKAHETGNEEFASASSSLSTVQK
jgi:hypothetical protein